MGRENTASLLPLCQPWHIIQLPLPEDEEDDLCPCHPEAILEQKHRPSKL